MISVCMATYNGAKYISEQLCSILKQIGENDEVIVSDDGSTDNTLEIIKSINDKRIKIYSNDYIHGYTGNFYNALKYAKGEYIFLSDQDDIWCDNKVTVTLEKLRIYNFVISDAMEVDAELNIIRKSRNNAYRVKSGFVQNLVRTRYIGCCMAFDRKVLESLFPVPTYENKYPHDLWIALIGEKYFKTCLITEPLILYRRHGENCSNGGDAQKGGLILVVKRILFRAYYMYHILRQHRIVKRVKEER